MNSAANQELPFYDVVVVGGSLSGAATATLLLRKNPGLKLLLLKN
jgi:2-polyprenyl-6-methoxyphenol hydroxylase-like FAD-dependent oxidoreductase